MKPESPIKHLLEKASSARHSVSEEELMPYHDKSIIATRANVLNEAETQTIQKSFPEPNVEGDLAATHDGTPARRGPQVILNPVEYFEMIRTQLMDVINVSPVGYFNIVGAQLRDVIKLAKAGEVSSVAQDKDLANTKSKYRSSVLFTTDPEFKKRQIADRRMKEKLKKKVEELKEEVEELRAEKENWKKEKVDLNRQVKSLGGQNKRLMDKVSDKDSAASQLKKENGDGARAINNDLRKLGKPKRGLPSDIAQASDAAVGMPKVKKGKAMS